MAGTCGAGGAHLQCTLAPACALDKPQHCRPVARALHPSGGCRGLQGVNHSGVCLSSPPSPQQIIPFPTLTTQIGRVAGHTSPPCGAYGQAVLCSLCIRRAVAHANLPHCIGADAERSSSCLGVFHPPESMLGIGMPHARCSLQGGERLKPGENQGQRPTESISVRACAQCV